MAREAKRFDILAVSQTGVEVSMKIVERDGALILWNGLDQHLLSLPSVWDWKDIER